MASLSSIQSAGIAATDRSSIATTLVGSQTSSRRASVEAIIDEDYVNFLFPNDLHAVNSHEVTRRRNLRAPVIKTCDSAFTSSGASPIASSRASESASHETVGDLAHLKLPLGLRLVDSHQVVRNRALRLEAKKSHTKAKKAKAKAIACKIGRGIKTVGHFIKEGLTEQPSDWDFPLDRPARKQPITQAQYDKAHAVLEARAKKFSVLANIHKPDSRDWVGEYGLNSLSIYC